MYVCLYAIQSNTIYDAGDCDGTIPNVFSLLFRHTKRISFYKPFNEPTRDSFYRQLVDGLTSKDCIAEELRIDDVFDGVDETSRTTMEKKIDYHTNIQPLVDALAGRNDFSSFTCILVLFHLSLLSVPSDLNQFYVSYRKYVLDELGSKFVLLL